MSALVIGDTVVVALFAVLVVGLLRSYATVLVRLDDLESGGGAPAAAAAGTVLPGVGTLSADLPTPPERVGRRRAIPVVGLDASGQEIQVSTAPGGHATLLAFMTSGCTSCQGFWRALGGEEGEDLRDQLRIVVVAKDPELESPSRLRAAGADELPLVHSSKAWDDYDVPGSPYFVYVDGPSGEVHGEGSALGWEQLQNLLQDAIADSEAAAAGRPTGSRAAVRAQLAEQALVEAGVAMDDPSLFSLSAHERQSLDA
jgi:hypothetical protein